MRAARWVAAVLALVAWGGLVLQYVIFAERVGHALAAWRFIGFFTVLSNIGIAVIATAVALGRGGSLAGARARLIGLTAIVTVGFVYSLLLRSIWNPTGLSKLADAILHDITPLLFFALWALMPHGELRWRDLKWALAPPLLYLAYSMARGALDGWYPYYFLNPAVQTAPELVTGMVGMMLVFAIIAACGIAIDLRLARRT